jgi:hypothetical protein
MESPTQPRAISSRSELIAGQEIAENEKSRAGHIPANARLPME